MATREIATRNAQYAANKSGRSYYIYRVGPHWMYDSRNDPAAIDAGRVVKLKDWTEILPQSETR